MKAGIVGLGRMGGGIRDRLRRAGHEAAGYDLDPALRDAGSLRELVAGLDPPRVVWLLLPAGGATGRAVGETADLLSPGDVLIDGGNSHYRDSIRRAGLVGERGLLFLDCGVSGGVHGREEGYCLMVGGPAAAFAIAEPLFAALAPEGGYARLGPSGAGHYAKMVHNGIEYGMMQALAEGFGLLRAYDDELDLRRVAALWGRGAVIRSRLLELAGRALDADPALDRVLPRVEDSGAGRWTVIEGAERGVPAPAAAAALWARFASRDERSFALRMLAALRGEFGGHAVPGPGGAPGAGGGPPADGP